MSVDWLAEVPKIELHLHIEGAMPYSVLTELVRKYAIDPSTPELEAIRNPAPQAEFLDFHKLWLWKTGLLREYDDFRLVAEASARHLAGQNIRYVEAFFCPADFRRWKLQTPRLIEAIRSGLSQVQQIEVALIIDLARFYGPEQAMRTVLKLDGMEQLGVVGVGMGGPEPGIPLEPFRKAYSMARKLGFHTTTHAGESADAESIWAALHHLEVERVGHGISGVRDPRLLDHLAARQIPLEVCPSSNLFTGVVKTLKDHPVRRFYEKGIPLSINTDNPLLLGNSLAGEFGLLQSELRFSSRDIFSLMIQGIHTSWLSQERKTALIEKVGTYANQCSSN